MGGTGSGLSKARLTGTVGGKNCGNGTLTRTCVEDNVVILGICENERDQVGASEIILADGEKSSTLGLIVKSKEPLEVLETCCSDRWGNWRN